MGASQQIDKLSFSILRHSHHMVVGAADVSRDLKQHFCGETGEKRDEQLGEPHFPVMSHKILELRFSDYEGSVHHHVSHSGGNIGNLQRHDTGSVNGTS